MSAPRKLKKSETLEIRLPYPTKLAFMARCQDAGVSASEALRGFIGAGEERLARLLGADLGHDWKDEGPSPEFYARGRDHARSRTWQN